MNRFKFRAWHTEQKRMFEVWGLGVDFVTENTLDGIDPGANAFCGDDMNFIEIMQFTGLKDKKGIPIYEGDKTKDGYIIMWNNERSLFGEHVYQDVLKIWSLISYPIDNSRMEIIGHIYQYESNVKEETQHPKPTPSSHQEEE